MANILDELGGETGPGAAPVRSAERQKSALPVFGDGQLNAILSTFQQRPDLDLDRFCERLDRCAWAYLEGHRAAKEMITPNRRAAHLGHLGELARAFSAALAAAIADPYTARYLHDAARDRADLDQGLPDFEKPKPSPVAGGEPTWQVERQIEMIRSRLAWLERVVVDPDIPMCGAAGKAAREVGKSGNRPNAALAEFVLSLRELYETAAAKPRPPNSWLADEEREEFFGFVQAVLAILDIEESRGKRQAALLALYQRAIDRLE